MRDLSVPRKGPHPEEHRVSDASRRKKPGILPRLLQRWLLPAEIRCGGILADLEDAAADGAGAGEMVEQRLAIVAADSAGELREILVEGAEHLQHRILVVEEHVAPH